MRWTAFSTVACKKDDNFKKKSVWEGQTLADFVSSDIPSIWREWRRLRRWHLGVTRRNTWSEWRSLFSLPFLGDFAPWRDVVRCKRWNWGEKVELLDDGKLLFDFAFLVSWWSFHLAFSCLLVSFIPIFHRRSFFSRPFASWQAASFLSFDFGGKGRWWSEGCCCFIWWLTLRDGSSELAVEAQVIGEEPRRDWEFRIGILPVWKILRWPGQYVAYFGCVLTLFSPYRLGFM